MVRPDQVSLGVLVSAVSRDAVDVAVARYGVGAKRSDGKLPAHVTAYLTMALCLFRRRRLRRGRDEGHRLVVEVGMLGRGLVGADRLGDHPGA